MIFFRKKNVLNKGTHLSQKGLKEFYKFRNLDTACEFCSAPYKSLLFIQSGEAKVCHYNRGFSLGNYPAKSIHDIWFDGKIEEIQTSLSELNFSKGCHDCGNQLFSKNFAAVGATRYDYLNQYKSSNGYPVLLDFQLKNTCPAECIMCSGEYSSSIRQNREKLAPYPDPYDEVFVDQLTEFLPHIKAASFTGGEPLSIDIYFKIWEKILAINPETDIFISTNAFHLNTKFLDLLSKLKFHFTISIDSVNETTYENIRRKISFQQVMHNVEILSAYCNKNNRHFAVKSCLIQQNAYELPEFINFWNTKNIKVYPKPVWFPPFASLRELPVNELTEIKNLYKSSRIKDNTKAKEHNKKYFASVITQIEKWISEKEKQPAANFENVSIQELKETLTASILHTIKKNKGLSDTDQQKIKDNYSTRLQRIYDTVESETKLRKALIHFLNFPAESIIAEMDRNSDEKLIARFQQAAE